MSGPNHDPSKVDAVSTEEMLAAFKRAGHTIRCAWSIFNAPRKSTGEMEAILLFHDLDDKKFAYAFNFERPEELEVLAHRLRKAAAFMRSCPMDPRPGT